MSVLTGWDLTSPRSGLVVIAEPGDELHVRLAQCRREVFARVPDGIGAARTGPVLRGFARSPSTMSGTIIGW